MQSILLTLIVNNRISLEITTIYLRNSAAPNSIPTHTRARPVQLFIRSIPRSYSNSIPLRANNPNKHSNSIPLRRALATSPPKSRFARFVNTGKLPLSLSLPLSVSLIARAYTGEARRVVASGLGIPAATSYAHRDDIVNVAAPCVHVALKPSRRS